MISITRVHKAYTGSKVTKNHLKESMFIHCFHIEIVRPKMRYTKAGTSTFLCQLWLMKPKMPW